MRTSKEGKLTQGRLKELLDYNPATGVFTWIKTNSNRVAVDSVAGYINSHGYRVIMVHGKNYQSARLVWLWMEGYFPEHDIDHINRDRSDNRWCNLRHVSRQCNSRNCGVRTDNTSGVTGVSYYTNRRKWTASVHVLGKHIGLGYFNKKKEAVIARWEAEKKYNFPECDSSSSAFLFLKERGLI